MGRGGEGKGGSGGEGKGGSGGEGRGGSGGEGKGGSGGEGREWREGVEVKERGGKEMEGEEGGREGEGREGEGGKGRGRKGRGGEEVEGRGGEGKEGEGRGGIGEDGSVRGVRSSAHLQQNTSERPTLAYTHTRSLLPTPTPNHLVHPTVHGSDSLFKDSCCPLNALGAARCVTSQRSSNQREGKSLGRTGH